LEADGRPVPARRVRPSTLRSVLCRGVGHADHGIDGHSATDAHAVVEPWMEVLRAGGGYADAVPARSKDPLAEFIAFTGRTPVG